MELSIILGFSRFKNASRRNIAPGGFILALAMLVGGCSAKDVLSLLDSPEIQLVKEGHLYDYPDKTVGEAVDGFFGSPSWESGEGIEGETKGKTLVDATGKITFMEKEITAAIQFVVDEKAGTFELLSLELNGIAQTALMRGALIRKMFE